MGSRLCSTARRQPTPHTETRKSGGRAHHASRWGVATSDREGALVGSARLPDCGTAWGHVGGGARGGARAAR